ncbi:MAG: hypothetical protein V4760_10565 [Bdellovibrionota bacterium]
MKSKLALTSAFILALTFFTSSAHAVIRPIIIPGKLATIMMQAMSSAGGGQMDPEPRALYDAIAMDPQDGPGGGKGKVIGTAENDFNLTCAYKSQVSELNVVCTITMKPSPRVKISMTEVEFVAEGPDAAMFYEKFAGPGATQPFMWRSQNGWVSIESHAEHFTFHFKR